MIVQGDLYPNWFVLISISIMKLSAKVFLLFFHSYRFREMSFYGLAHFLYSVI